MSLVINNLNVSNTLAGNGINIRNSVRVATTTNGTLSTSFRNGDTIDGVILATNDRILLKNQTTASENGIYIVKISGIPARSDGCNVGDSAAGIIVFINEGTTNADTGWMCTSNSGSDIISTNNLTFTKFTNDVTSNNSSTDNAIVRYDGTGGKTLQNSGVTIDDSDNLNMNSSKIISLANPTSDNDAANKIYVDNTVTNFEVKEAVYVASTIDLDSNSSISGTITYTATGGSSGRGQITATLVTTDTFTVDSVNLGSANDGTRVLLKDQTTGAQNGIWTTTVSGTSLTLDRATDFDADAEVVHNVYVFVQQGTTNSDQSFVLNTPNNITIGGASGTALTFVLYNTMSNITGGSGLTKTGSVLDVGGSATIISNSDTIEVNSSATANQVLLSSGSVGTASTYGALPLNNSSSVTSTLGIANGGTNTSSFTAGSRIISTNSGNTALESTTIDPTNIVQLASTQTLTNKTFTDSTIYFQDDVDNTKKLQLQLSGITTATIRTLTIPDANTTLVGTDITQTLTNKTLTAPIISTISNTGTVTLPTATDTLVARATTDTLTNKTLNSTTNTITSDNLHSATTTIDVSSATAPTTGQVLTATSSTAATWQTTSATITNSSITATTDTSTTSSSYTLINSMTTTPASGTYLVSFSSSGNSTNTGADANYALFNDGTIIQHTERNLNYGGGSHASGFDSALHTQAITTVNGSQAIEVKYKRSAGTFAVHERSLILLKLS